METYLITGGAGFVGSNLALMLKKADRSRNIVVFDNLRRRGSELNLEKFKKQEIAFVHGDIRNIEDFDSFKKIDYIIDASAEPSVLAGINSSPKQIIDINLIGTINILEVALRFQAKLIFLSTSRVYSINHLNQIKFAENEGRFLISPNQNICGVSNQGITEEFPIMGPKSIYGATKLSSELLIQEYNEYYGVPSVINRCGVIAGPGQFGKVDQGVLVLWVARHFWKRNLKYIGFEGKGKQVRDFLHIDDLFNLISTQIKNFDLVNGGTFNVGGGEKGSLSLKELTSICEEVVGNKIIIDKEPADRVADIRIYISDISKVNRVLNWFPKKLPTEIVKDVYYWIQSDDQRLSSILNG